jgi:hypothetical protein
MALEGRYGVPVETVATCTKFSFTLKAELQSIVLNLVKKN